MSILDEANRLASTGGRDEAVALVERAAAADDPEALFALANWRLFGLFGPRDLAETHCLLDRGMKTGDVQAVRAKAILIGNGTGCAEDPSTATRLLQDISGRDADAARQLDMLSRMRDNGKLSGDRIETLCEAPWIRLHRALLTPEECGYLQMIATPHLQPSFVINPTSGARMANPIRTSLGMSFGPTQEDLVVRRINARIARASATDIACGEPLQILRYEPGQEYRPHTDSRAGEANPRVWTVLVYLNDGYSGGATQFQRVGLDVRGATGDALIFRNIDAHGQPDMATLHAGLPVIAGLKWLATRWIRTHP